MSIFTVFDWISPLIQMIQEGESVSLTPGQMNALKNRGWKIHGAFEDLRNPDTYLVKVEPPSNEGGLKIF